MAELSIDEMRELVQEADRVRMEEERAELDAYNKPMKDFTESEALANIKDEVEGLLDFYVLNDYHLHKLRALRMALDLFQ